MVEIEMDVWRSFSPITSSSICSGTFSIFVRIQSFQWAFLLNCLRFYFNKYIWLHAAHRLETLPWKWGTTQLFTDSPRWDRKENQEGVRKLVGWDMNGLIGGANAAHGSNEKCCSLADTCSATSRRKAGLSGLEINGKDRCNHSEHRSFLLLSPSFSCCAWCHMAGSVPLVSWGQLSWVCHLPTAHSRSAVRSSL